MVYGQLIQSSLIHLLHRHVAIYSAQSNSMSRRPISRFPCTFQHPLIPFFFQITPLLKKLFENVVLRLFITLNAIEKRCFTYMTCNKPIRPALNAISNKKIISATPVLFRQPWSKLVGTLI